MYFRTDEIAYVDLYFTAVLSQTETWAKRERERERERERKLVYASHTHNALVFSSTVHLVYGCTRFS